MPTVSLFAERLSHVTQSSTLAIAKQVEELRASGRFIINISVGEPDFPTPDHIIEAAYKAMRGGATKYTAVDGTPELKEAVIGKFKRENGLTYVPSQIIVSAGAKQTIFNAIMSTVGPGDGVIIPAPYWVSYPLMVKIAQGEPIFINTKAEHDFKLQPDSLEQTIKEHGNIKWLMLNSPCNPSGAIYTRDELKSLADVLLKHPQIHILTDDIYEHMVYDDIEYTTIAQVEPKLYDRTLTVNGVSKAYNMTGWRIGYAGGPEHLIKKMSQIQGQATGNPSSVSQAAALAALTGPQDFIAKQVQEYKSRRDLVFNAISEIPELDCHKPHGAFYVYPGCAKLIGKKTPSGKELKTDIDVASYFLESENIAVVPGSAFGLSPYFRISYSFSADVLKEACSRIKRACERCVGNE
ncbi:MAG: pyridoxal phosphate-dependent aminotransferase [Alphaproteobacteria bacterium]|nr:pyridoxal phosphate-dependent aminotransferase [Alphaproteobacteria bacterium]